MGNFFKSINNSATDTLYGQASEFVSVAGNSPQIPVILYFFCEYSILFQLFIGIAFVFCTLVMIKQLNFLLNTKELGIERHNVGAVVYCSENVPFKEILEQMPNVTKYLSGFQTPIPKMYFSRSEERRVGKECASMCRSRWSPYH